MSKEALHNTKVELEKQKKDLEDINLAISKLENLRNKEQKELNSKRTRKVELETKILENTQEQKKESKEKEEKDKLVEQKKELEEELSQILKDIPVYTAIVDEYNEKIKNLKKNKDIVEPKLSSAKKESLKEKVGHFAKNYWKYAVAAVTASAILYGGYELGKRNSSDKSDLNKDKNPVENTENKNKKNKSEPDSNNKKDSLKSNLHNDLGSKGNSNSKKTEKKTAKYEEKVIKKNYDLDKSHGDLSKNTENKKAGVENNVYNSFTYLQTIIQNQGKDNLFYYPHQVGTKSPYWNRKHGTETINNQQDYINHINKNLIPGGFSGKTFSNIEHFGFKLNKDEFISDLKYDVIVKANVIGGEGYVLLKKGTAVVYERKLNEQGKPCNVLSYILDCMNPIYANDPHTNVDGSGGFRL